MRKRFNLPTVIGLILLGSVITFSITFLSVRDYFNRQLSAKTQTNEALSKVSETLDIITKNYVGDYDFNVLLDGALSGAVAATGDQWSHYLNAEEYAEYRLNLQNKAVGIGVSVHSDGAGTITVTRVHPGSPAEEAGLRRFDVIVMVDGLSVADLSTEEAYNMIRGSEGTTVTLGIRRHATGEEETIQFVRRSYTVSTVTAEIVGDNIGYIKIENFDELVDINFQDTVNTLLKADIRGLIFDVRDNPGGQKNVMVEMLDMLLPEGVLFISRDRDGNEEVDRSDGNQMELPMVVLVNESSVSAAEFFAAALKDFEKAVIVGAPTTGKGYSQTTKPLADGSALILSTREYFTPKGKSLIGVGLVPDVPVELSETKTRNFALLSHEEDDQFVAALSAMEDQITRAAEEAAAEAAAAEAALAAETPAAS